eukprot:TRINITY_DN3179_c0_g1_i1.p1 TRINITY_DN3179_c0_g1~~TRINITY_DN3179_c0_g1_i1.p1  ORF type:complete len:177 (+),score=57.52 TRINITY_DN3179_c0_g1_i1:40-531(+)
MADSGKDTHRKDLAAMYLPSQNAYICSVATGTRSQMAHAQKCILEAERFPGPSLVLLLSYCKQHHTDLPVLEYLDESVKSGFWPVYSWDPRRAEEDKHPLEILEDKPDYERLEPLFKTQARFMKPLRSYKEKPSQLPELVSDIRKRWGFLEMLKNAPVEAFKN